MSTLSYRILPVPDDKTYEVRLIVDGIDWLGDDLLGLDPPDLVRELTIGNQTHLVLGRCCCGVLGCGDLVVEMKLIGDAVEWSRRNFETVVFDSREYDRQVIMLAQDQSWEPICRAAERHLNQMFTGKVTDDDYAFEWCSTRIKPNIVSLSVTRNGQQKLLEFLWDGASLASELSRGKSSLGERFRG